MKHLKERRRYNSSQNFLFTITFWKQYFQKARISDTFLQSIRTLVTRLWFAESHQTMWNRMSPADMARNLSPQLAQGKPNITSPTVAQCQAHGTAHPVSIGDFSSVQPSIVSNRSTKNVHHKYQQNLWSYLETDVLNMCLTRNTGENGTYSKQLMVQRIQYLVLSKVLLSMEEKRGSYK